MSALASILHAKGHIVSGSDITDSDQVDMLREKGISVAVPHNKKNIPDRCDLIVINSAISPRNVELSEARRRRIAIITREDLLAEVSRDYRTCIAVAGTHGKSTTTAMIHAILIGAGLNPTTHNGAVMLDYMKNYHIGGKNIFITEACEFKRSFLTLNPTIAVVTNVDCDHLDCYSCIEDIKNAFKQFCNQSDIVIRNQNCVNSTGLKGKGKTFAFSDIEVKLLAHIDSNHNRENAHAAVRVAEILDIPHETIIAALQNFKGIQRRFEKIHQIGGCDIISDYAHHPTELRATIEMASGKYQKFLIIFQPHTYTRTKELFAQFIDVLSNIDVVLYKTYAAREKHTQGRSGRELSAALGCKYIASPQVLAKTIENLATKFDAIILTGAGDMVYHLQLYNS